MPEEKHERRFNGAAERLRYPERIARLDVGRVIALSIEGLAASRVLDVGTGTGVFAEAFAAIGLEVAGIDANEELLREARRLVPGVEFKHAVAEEIPYGDGTFDIVFLGHVLHEADVPGTALLEARRVSRARVVVLEWPYEAGEHGPPLEHRLRQEAIVDMAERAGLERVEMLKLTHMDFYRMAVPAGV